MFTEQELREFKEDGLTDEEIEILVDADAMADTINLVPNDLEAFLREVDERVPNDVREGMRAIVEIAQKDPEFFQKFLALDIAMSAGIGELPEEPKEDTIVTRLSKEDYKTASDNFFKTLAGLSDSDRDEFLNLIANITEEQKADMVARLVKK